MFESDSEGNLVEFDLNIYLFDPLACAAAARSNAQASAIALTKFSSFVLRQPSHPTSGWLHRARQAPFSVCLHTTAGSRLAERKEAHFSSSASDIKAGTSISGGYVRQ